jgi:hypothetical protein
VELWENAEGVVIYSEDSQHLRKIKAALYCKLHKILSGMKSIDNVLDVFMESPRFKYTKDFHNFIATTLDFEVAQACKRQINKICDAYCKVLDKMKKVDTIVDTFKDGYTRKEQALQIQERWNGWRKSYAFSLLDNKGMNDKMLRKAIEEELK